MKWGRKKDSYSLPKPTLINHLFPIFWLKKLKPKSRNVEPKAKLKGKLDVPCLSGNSKEGQVYSGINDLYYELEVPILGSKSRNGNNQGVKDSQRKSFHIKRRNRTRGRKVNTRIKACSSRNATKNECKIKALEDMKRGKKMKKRRIEQKTAFDSYAVIKSSYDPEQDFRDSMLEMITGKGIKRAEEFEELLVCYLTLNCRENYDLIIKVFRQVWFELINQVDFDHQLEHEYSCHY